MYCRSVCGRAACNSLAIGLQPGRDIRNVLGGQSEGMWIIHERALEAALLCDALLGNQLGNATGRLDHHGGRVGPSQVTVVKSEAVNDTAIFQENLCSLIAKGDLGRGVRDGAGDDIPRLGGPPAPQAGTVVLPAAVDLMTENTTGSRCSPAGSGYPLYSLS